MSYEGLALTYLFGGYLWALFIPAIIFALIVGWLAHERGRDEFGWAILGFFFGVIALLFLVCAPSKKETVTINRVINVTEEVKPTEKTKPAAKPKVKRARRKA